MNTALDVIEFRATKPMEEVFFKLPIPLNIKSLYIVDESTEFALFDERSNIFSDIHTNYLHKPFVLIRFKARQSGTYKVILKGYDDKLNEVLVYELIGVYDDTRFVYTVMFFCFSVIFLFSCLFLYDRFNNSYFPFETNKNIVLQPQKILFIGTTEKYCDTEVLLNRFQRYYDVTIDCETYSNKPFQELLKLLHEGKIKGIVTPLKDVNTSSIYWSEVYAIDNLGRDGLRLGVPKTESNIRLIRQFNE